MKHTELVIRKRQIEPLRPILKSWFCVLQEYIDRTGDLPFWYRERPQVGFFAAAAWRIGWAALEEWGMIKGSQRKQSQGRNDLWIGYYRKPGFFIEAKHTWCDLQKGEKHCSHRLEKALAAAKDSAKQLHHKPKIAVVFVSPVWKPSHKSPDFKKAKDEWIKFCKKVDADAVAFFFPKSLNIPKGKNDSMCVGSTLFVKLVNEHSR